MSDEDGAKGECGGEIGILRAHINSTGPVSFCPRDRVAKINAELVSRSCVSFIGPRRVALHLRFQRVICLFGLEAQLGLRAMSVGIW